MEYCIEHHRGIGGDYNYALRFRIPSHELVAMTGSVSFKVRMWFAWTLFKGFLVVLTGRYV